MQRFPKLSIIALMLAVVMALSIGGGLLASGPSAGAELPTTLDVDPMPAFVGAGDAITSVNSDAIRSDRGSTGSDTLSLQGSAAAVVLENGDFEDGSTFWLESVQNRDLITTTFPTGVTPHGGSWAAWLGTPDLSTTYTITHIQQQVTVPESDTFLAYWHWIRSEDFCGDYDHARVLIDDTIVHDYILCQDSSTDGWVKHGASLSAFAGQTVELKIQVQTDYNLSSELFVDDVSFAPEPSIVYLPLVARRYPPLSLPNGDFEEGPTVWIESSEQRDHVILHEDDPELRVYAYSGDWAALLGAANNETSYIQQEVTVPLTAPYLVYWHWISSSDDCGYDFGWVKINGNIVVEYSLCLARITTGWVQQSVDLGAYVGQTVLLHIQSTTDDSVPSELYIDDFTFQSIPATDGGG